jgi:hypothetical protein
MGCAGSRHRIDVARDAFAAGDLVKADQSLRKVADQHGRYRDAAALDLAMVELAAGEPEKAELRLRALRDQFDRQPTIAPAHEAVALATDDTARRFRPSGYEQVMIRAMLAVCSLADDSFDAESYTLQAMAKQAELARLAEERGITNVADVYQPIALAPYLRGVLREATHHDFDDATRAYQLVSAVRPQFSPAQDDITRATEGVHSAPGHGVLYVIACVGRGPVLEEAVEPTTTLALQISSMFLNSATNDEGGDSRRSVPALPNLASVKVPKVVVPDSHVAAVGVRVDGTLFGATQTLTDVGELAVRQSSAEMPWTIARAVVRRATKEAVVATVGDTMGLDGDAGTLFHFAAATAWSGAEQADTRCWGLLPREIQVLRAELPVGDHSVQLQPMSFSGGVSTPGITRMVSIVDGRNQYLVVIAPSNALYVVE